jgi:hypothetical protein
MMATRVPRVQQWEASTDHDFLLRCLRNQGSERRWRLLCCACFRGLYGRRVQDPRTSAAVAVAERYAEGLANKAQLVAARRAARAAAEPSPHVKRAAWWATYGRPRPALRSLVWAEYPAAWVTRWDQVPARARATLSRADEALVCALIRDVFANPFRPAAIDPGWLRWNGGTVPAVAREVEEGAYDRLPVLADALEDAGCTDEVVLGHGRNGLAHVHGCWLLDAVLGRG